MTWSNWENSLLSKTRNLGTVRYTVHSVRWLYLYLGHAWIFCWERKSQTGAQRWIFLSIHLLANPTGSMYGIFTYIQLMFMVNVGKYTIHGSYVNNLSLLFLGFKWSCYCEKVHLFFKHVMKQKWINEKFFTKTFVSHSSLSQSQPPPTWVDDFPGRNPWLLAGICFSRSLQCTWMCQEVSKWLVSGL